MGLITGPLRRRAARHFAGMNLLRQGDANTFGIESRGPWQIRGNGTLALTADALLFAQWVPSRLLRIPVDAITEVGTTRAWLGKTIGQLLLVVHWRADVASDAVALRVRDVDDWIAALNSLRQGWSLSR